MTGMRASFMGSGASRRLMVQHAAQGARRGRVLYLHPFAEEMNKSRRMVALQARQFAAAGFDVALLDLHGCGDSAGDFADASWSSWIEDAMAAVRHIGGPDDGSPLWLWGVRAGCLLACATLPQVGGPCNLLFWNPPQSGQSCVQQFLRMAMAAQLADGAKGVVERLRRTLADGGAADVAGYRLSSALAQGLNAATLRPPAAGIAGHLAWLELSRSDPPAMAPWASGALDSWRGAGWQVETHALAGTAFWQSAEIEVVPGLLTASTTSIQAARERVLP